MESDPEAKQIFYEEMREEYETDEHIAEIIQADYGVFTYLADMGACIETIRKRLDELDEIKPYDNKLTYQDVTNVSCLPSRKGTAAVFCLESNHGDMFPRIVEIIGVEHKDGKTKMIKPWAI